MPLEQAAPQVGSRAPSFRAERLSDTGALTGEFVSLAFLIIYISEAHPEHGWQVGINHTQSVVYDQPLIGPARAAIAADCIADAKIRIPVALDNMENSISEADSASPERLYLIDGDGMVRHRSIWGLSG